MRSIVKKEQKLLKIINDLIACVDRASVTRGVELRDRYTTFIRALGLWQAHEAGNGAGQAYIELVRCLLAPEIAAASSSYSLGGGGLAGDNTWLVNGMEDVYKNILFDRLVWHAGYKGCEYEVREQPGEGAGELMSRDERTECAASPAELASYKKDERSLLTQVMGYINRMEEISPTKSEDCRNRLETFVREIGKWGDETANSVHDAFAQLVLCLGESSPGPSNAPMRKRVTGFFEPRGSSIAQQCEEVYAGRIYTEYARNPDISYVVRSKPGVTSGTMMDDAERRECIRNATGVKEAGGSGLEMCGL